MRRLSGMDVLLLYSEAPQIHMHTMKIGVLDVTQIDGGFSFERFRANAAPRLQALAPLRYQLVAIPGRVHHPMWRVNADLDLDYHLRRVSVPAPGGRRELDELIGQIASTPLDRNRPLWEMYVAEGLLDGRVAIIHKVHHVLADGVASANQMAAALDPDLFSGRQATADVSFGAADLVLAAGRDHLKQIGAIPQLVGDTVRGVARVRRRSKERGTQKDIARNFAPPPTFMNHVVSPGRRFATAPLPLADVKELSKKLSVTINDIVLATAAGALRQLLLRYGGVADAPLIAGVPVSFNTSPDRLSGNEFSYMTPSLPVHVDEPLERVRLASLSANIAKENYQLLGPTLMGTWMSYLPPGIAPKVLRWQSSRLASSAIMNLTISNVPGPRVRGHIEGATISEIYSVGPLVAGSGVNITVWSYVDQLNISVLTDDATVDDPHEITDAMLAAFAQTRTAAGLSATPASMRTAMPLAEASG